MVDFQCPVCGRPLTVRESNAGRRGKCSCGAVVRVPAPVSATPPATEIREAEVDDNFMAAPASAPLRRRGLSPSLKVGFGATACAIVLVAGYLIYLRSHSGNTVPVTEPALPAQEGSHVVKVSPANPGNAPNNPVAATPSTVEQAKKLYESGVRYREQQKTESAAKAFDDASKLGNVDAMNALGLCYRDGVGVDKSSETAAKLFEKAAGGGSAEAMHHLGSMYSSGIGVSKDEKKALELFLAAAHAQYRGAMTNVGVCYLNGAGTAKDAKIAVKWFRQAAESGDPAGMYNLGLMYGKGEGVAESRVEAMRWIRRAAEAGCPEAAATIKEIGAVVADTSSGAANSHNSGAATNGTGKSDGPDRATLIDRDPAASFELFLKGFVSHVNAEAPSDDYQVKIEDGSTIEVKKTDNLAAPYVATLVGGLSQYQHGKKVSDVSRIGNDNVRFPVLVRCTFFPSHHKWQLRDVEVNPWGSGWTSVFGSTFVPSAARFWRDAYNKTQNP